VRLKVGLAGNRKTGDHFAHGLARCSSAAFGCGIGAVGICAGSAPPAANCLKTLKAGFPLHAHACPQLREIASLSCSGARGERLWRITAAQYGVTVSTADIRSKQIHFAAPQFHWSNLANPLELPHANLAR